ncbi:MAG: Mu transposase C-terminal domain-containing protein [Candidatus Cloacimonetes bacterium]|nr:Mu transposase C-terminal domain-containing protein [Candidatus Cloacimonadota bacterium]
MRNEEWIRNLKERKPLEIDQAKALIGFYFQELYGRTPHGGINRNKPYEVFSGNMAPPERQIGASELNFLMLKVEERKVSNNGIRLNNVLYWNDEMAKHVGKKVYLRYDIMDMRSILVYDVGEKLICQATARRLTHPFVKLAVDRELAEKDLRRQLTHQRKLEADVKRKSAILRKQVDDAVSELPFPNITLDQTAFNESPLLSHQETPRPFEQIENLAHKHAGMTESNAEADDELVLKKLDKLFENIGL